MQTPETTVAALEQVVSTLQNNLLKRVSVGGAENAQSPKRGDAKEMEETKAKAEAAVQKPESTAETLDLDKLKKFFVNTSVVAPGFKRRNTAENRYDDPMQRPMRTPSVSEGDSSAASEAPGSPITSSSDSLRPTTPTLPVEPRAKSDISSILRPASAPKLRHVEQVGPSTSIRIPESAVLVMSSAPSRQSLRGGSQSKAVNNQVTQGPTVTVVSPTREGSGLPPLPPRSQSGAAKRPSVLPEGSKTMLLEQQKRNSALAQANQAKRNSLLANGGTEVEEGGKPKTPPPTFSQAVYDAVAKPGPTKAPSDANKTTSSPSPK